MADIIRSDIVRIDLNQGLIRKHVGAILATGDSGANRFGVQAYRDGVPVTLDGCGVTGYFMRPGETTLVLQGRASGSVAYVDLEQDCYSKDSSFSLAVKISADGITNTVRIIDGYIVLTQGDTLVLPGRPVPALDELFAQIAAVEHGAKMTAAPAIISAAMGEVVSITDSADRPLAGLTLCGKTTQDGTPTPDAPVPLVNVGAGGSIGIKSQGKNLLNYDAWKTVTIQRGTAVWENNGVTLTATADDCYTGDGLGWEENGVEFPAKIFVTPGENIILSWEADRSYSANIFIFPNGTTDGAVACNNNENRPLVYTATEGVTYVTIRFSAAKAGDVISYRNIMVERGRERTAFEPYKDGGSVTVSTPNGLPGIPVTSGGNYADENGQLWLRDEIDFGRGVYLQRVGVRTLNGTETWYTGTTLDGRNNRYTTGVPDKMPEIDNVTVSRVLCNAYPAIIPNAGYAGTVDYGVQGQNDTTGIIINDARYPNKDLDGFKASLAAKPITVMYVLATPIETPLSADVLTAYRAMTSRKPTTTVYNDSGARMAVDYIADTKLYIDKKIAAIAAASLNV